VELLEQYQTEGEWSYQGLQAVMTCQGQNDTLLASLNDLLEQTYKDDTTHTLKITVNPRTGELTNLTWEAQGTSSRTGQAMTTTIQVAYTGFNRIRIPEDFGQVAAPGTGRRRKMSKYKVGTFFALISVAINLYIITGPDSREGCLRGSMGAGGSFRGFPW